jgi:hypothetical protein
MCCLLFLIGTDDVSVTVRLSDTLSCLKRFIMAEVGFILVIALLIASFRMRVSKPCSDNYGL